MPTLPSNARAIAAAKATKRTEYRINGCRGLVLDVLPTGKATYRAVYHVRKGGKRVLRKVTLGGRDVVALADARQRALEIAAEVAAGSDPAGAKAADRNAITLRQLVERRIADDRDLAPSTRAYADWAMRKHVLPALGDLAADAITAEQVIDLFSKVGSMAPTTADRAKAVLSGTYTWGKGRRIVTTNPAAGLPNQAASLPRDRVLSDAELRAILTGAGQHMTEAMAIIVKLALLTGMRGGEVCSLKGAYVHDLDNAEALVIIPGDSLVKGRRVKGRMKAGLEHRVPLSRQASALLRRAIDLSEGDEYVFPARNFSDASSTPHVDRHSLSRAFRRLCDKLTASATSLNLADATMHDSRHTLATWLGEHDVDDGVISRVLAHTPQGITRRVYDKSKRDPAVRAALQRWADHLSSLTEGGEGRTATNVVHFPRT